MAGYWLVGADNLILLTRKCALLGLNSPGHEQTQLRQGFLSLSRVSSPQCAGRHNSRVRSISTGGEGEDRGGLAVSGLEVVDFESYHREERKCSGF